MFIDCFMNGGSKLDLRRKFIFHQIWKQHLPLIINNVFTKIEKIS